MIVKPKLRDLKTVIFYSGKIIAGFSFTFAIPIIVALLYGEWNQLPGFLFAITASMIFWLLSDIFFYTEREMTWLSGVLVVTFAWVIATCLGALPFYMSGFYGSYIDAIFDTMSGFTTTGLTLIQDLDHAPFSISMWRHELQYLGGQGIIVLSLVFLARSLRGAIKIYIAEAKDERLWPNIKETAANIWKIANVYLLLGTISLAVFFAKIGAPIDTSFFHGLWITMGAWSTGGYAPSTLSMQLYHNFIIEIIVTVIMILGGMNFAIHFLVWRGKPLEVFKNFETRTFLFYTALGNLMVFIGLSKSLLYKDLISIFRFSMFQVISATTTTGFSNVPTSILKLLWGEFAIIWMIIAMALGAHACSTGGGFKAMRVGLTVKGLIHEIKKMINPEASVIFTTYHHLRKNAISDYQVKMAMLIIILYICTYLFGAIVGISLGYDFISSLYESVSAAANVGLSIGITSPSMPVLLKVVYIFEMWLGRLEFSSILATFGIIVALVRGK